MARIEVRNVRIAGIASAVPRQSSTVKDIAAAFGESDARKLAETSGIHTRHIAKDICSSDLCYKACELLLESLGWTRDSVDGLLFVSQTPDCLLPATSCILHGKLGLSKSCLAFDINLGCSGYVYGLFLAARLAEKGMNRILLLVGDTISRISSPQDRSVAALFGDAGTATALQYEQGATPITSSTMWFTLMTDGTGSQHLTVPAGGFRQPRTSSTSIRIEREGHNLRSDEDLFMNGAEVFSFTLREVAPLVQSTLEAAGLAQEDVSYFVFHQANRFMLEHLSRKMKIANDRMLYSLADFGNTSCASIPLTISHAFGNVGRLSADNVLLAGFGVGLSWGAAVCSFRDTIVPRIIYLAGKESSVC